jgi:UDP-N-acetylmuramate: L-alanyl-gamma-D-glutamyl-meso-diaminopimelate ligase
LNKSFLEQYADTMMEADRAIVFYSPDTIEHKKLPPISVSDVKTAFNRFDLEVYCNNNELVYALESLPLKESNLLMMSSGNFHGLNLNQVITEILN